MPLSALIKPITDPTQIFEHFRNGYSTDLLAVAAIDFDVFGKLAHGPKSFNDLRDEIGRSALRLRDIVVRDAQGTVIASAPIAAAQSERRLNWLRDMEFPFGARRL
jgi:hypothetical protein